MDIYRKLAENNPLAYIGDVAITLNNLATLHKNLNHHKEAEENYEEALNMYRKLSNINPDAYIGDVATTLNNLASLHDDLSRYFEAEEEYKEALEIRRRLATKKPAEYISKVAMILNNLARLHHDLSRPEEAEKEYVEALHIYRQLAKDNPNTYMGIMAMTLNNLASLHDELNYFIEAEMEYKEALHIYGELAKDNPATYLSKMAMALNNLAYLHIRFNHQEEAREEYKKALQIHRKQDKNNYSTAFMSKMANDLNNLNILYKSPNLPYKGSIVVNMFLKGNNTTSTSSSRLKGIKDYSLTKIDNGEKVALPIIAYYGTERGQIKPVERRRNFTDIFPRWDIYKSDSLESATDFKRFFTWFERNEDMERREQNRQNDYDYTSPVLNVVRRALNLLFEHLKNPRVEVSPLRFVMDDDSDPENPIEKRIERMSDGYRIMVALVADIASRLAEGNPSEQCSGLKDPLDGNGIVLIDEIDLHLHPKLQRVIIGKLTKIFPNVQFIVSTHSPNVVIGALDLVQIIKLDQGKIDSQVNTSQYDKYDISLLLLSDLFGVDNVRSQKFKDLVEEEDRLLAKDSLSEEELNRLKELAMLLRAYGYSDGKEKI